MDIFVKRCPLFLSYLIRALLKKWYVSRHTSIATEDVKGIVTTGSLKERAFLVAVDHSTRSVVLSIRGTYNVYDAMVDLVCNSTGARCLRQGSRVPAFVGSCRFSCSADRLSLLVIGPRCLYCPHVGG